MRGATATVLPSRLGAQVRSSRQTLCHSHCEDPGFADTLRNLAEAGRGHELVHLLLRARRLSSLPLFARLRLRTPALRMSALRPCARAWALNAVATRVAVRWF